ncbi:uncharacterized protein ACO6RY_11700 [Pungitius sinensis]
MREAVCSSVVGPRLSSGLVEKEKPSWHGPSVDASPAHARTHAALAGPRQSLWFSSCLSSQRVKIGAKDVRDIQMPAWCTPSSCAHRGHTNGPTSD